MLLPSNQPPTDTNDKSFRNLGYPLDWEGFSVTSVAGIFKPFAGGGWKNVYRLHNPEEFYRAYGETGQLVMMLQEEVKFDMTSAAIQSINGMFGLCHTSRGILIIAVSNRMAGAEEILQRVEQDVLTLNQFLVTT
ncbi:MAG: hypothetical protein Udaeo2_01660 [Candidatus Udaeobacter sp.]|nr:MAG: hypothetical protein Udaeo2_01660 [Candidatus Udaeobacter sp.]